MYGIIYIYQYLGVFNPKFLYLNVFNIILALHCAPGQHTIFSGIHQTIISKAQLHCN